MHFAGIKFYESGNGSAYTFKNWQFLDSRDLDPEFSHFTLGNQRLIGTRDDAPVYLRTDSSGKVLVKTETSEYKLVKTRWLSTKTITDPYDDGVFNLVVKYQDGTTIYNGPIANHAAPKVFKNLIAGIYTATLTGEGFAKQEQTVEVKSDAQVIIFNGIIAKFPAVKVYQDKYSDVNLKSSYKTIWGDPTEERFQGDDIIESYNVLPDQFLTAKAVDPVYLGNNVSPIGNPYAIIE